MKTRIYVMLIALFVLSINNRVNAQEYHYDVNNDGEVNITDAILVVNYILWKDIGGLEPTITTGEAIDLGLPSGLKWASCNVGATKPEESGGYFAWGEIEEKEDYSQSTYSYYQNGSYVDIGSNISGTQYDVARAKWGGKWRMPKDSEVKELLDNCTIEWITFNNVVGRKFTSKINGNSIFLPAAGSRKNLETSNLGVAGDYWSGSRPSDCLFLAIFLVINDTRVVTGNNWVYTGFNVRPVTD